ncbi:MAG: hypothetical protein HW406_1560 [Candidatus Brocadiaceae bacterium]|nr:hypothetical protein [Candidatus Brocadiaceae bacterium]
MKTQQQLKGQIPGGRQPRKHATKTRAMSHLRRQKLIAAALDGKPLRRVGLETGLSPKTVDTQISNIMKEPEVRQAFARILEESGLDSKFLANKLRELIDAKTTIFSQKDGKFCDSREIEAWETQRKTTELICRLAGHLKEQDTSTINNSGLMQIVFSQLHTG